MGRDVSRGGGGGRFFSRRRTGIPTVHPPCILDGIRRISAMTSRDDARTKREMGDRASDRIRSIRGEGAGGRAIPRGVAPSGVRACERRTDKVQAAKWISRRRVCFRRVVENHTGTYHSPYTRVSRTRRVASYRLSSIVLRLSARMWMEDQDGRVVHKRYPETRLASQFVHTLSGSASRPQ